MKYLKNVKGITKRDKTRNRVRDELEVEEIDNVIERNQLRCFGHICRMNDNTQVKQIWETKTSRRRG